MKRWFIALVLAACAGWLGGAEAPKPPLSLAIGGLIEDYLEPCGCGGRTAGGLARRAELINGWRARAVGAKVAIELGNFGLLANRVPTITRSLARMGADVVALAPADLERWEGLRDRYAEHALAATSVIAPPVQTDLPRSRVVDNAGWRVGVLSVSQGQLADPDLLDVVSAELSRLRGEEHADLVVMASYLSSMSTTILLDRLPAELRPEVVALATEYDYEEQPRQGPGGVWIAPVARRGRSLTVLNVTPAGAISGSAQLVLEGPKEPVISAWVDDYYRAERVGEVANAVKPEQVVFARPDSCLECHGIAVKAWREHPHASAVETLEERGRDVAGCLGCHDETFRRASVRPPTSGDRGVQCATCHDQLQAHLKAPKTNRPTTINQSGCETCHSLENSPHWDYSNYLKSVAAACGGEVVPPPGARIGGPIGEQ